MNSEAAAYFPGALASTSGASEEPDCAPEIPAYCKSETSDIPTGIVDQTTENSDEQLMELVREGSRDALAILFRKHNRAVRNVAYRILRDEAEADDLVQEVFLFLFQKAALFDISKGSASSWIIQIAYHRAISRRQYLTVRQHYDGHELEEARHGSDERRLFVDTVVAKTFLSRLRGQVSTEQRETLEFHFFDGYTFREIAEKTGQTLGNVRNHYYRGLERLRTCVFPKEGV